MFFSQPFSLYLGILCSSSISQFLERCDFFLKKRHGEAFGISGRPRIQQSGFEELAFRLKLADIRTDHPINRNDTNLYVL